VLTSAQVPSTSQFEHPPAIVQLGPATAADLLGLWREHLPALDGIEQLATRFSLAPGRVVRAATEANRIAGAAGRTAATADDIAHAIGASVARQVEVLGTRIDDRPRWDDVVLPEETLDGVRELIARVQHRHQVLDQWGFREKLSKGIGLAALFSGPPGTGKTLIASLIANELGQDLYQIDLSRVVSKWIGETEKNLARVFDAAEGANIVLLFDEADALFAKRTEVKSSNDRHSNAEVNYLLQRVERFEGVCILTTNLEGSIDPAFKRRLAVRLTFQMPEKAERLQLWTRLVPSSAAIAKDVDFEEIAEDYELAGGNIRNAILRAAFLAASLDRPIDMDLMTRAIKLEYRDAGKLSSTGRLL
jgi:SpoVK/Ycf46/Vps4 family AAA+-type ATPase